MEVIKFQTKLRDEFVRRMNKLKEVSDAMFQFIAWNGIKISLLKYFLHKKSYNFLMKKESSRRP